MHRTTATFATSLFFTIVTPASAQGEDPREAFFRLRVAPMLHSRCFACHCERRAEGELRVDSREAMLRGGERGPAIVPGNPGDSLLLHAVHRKNKGLEMPPKEKLSDSELADLEKWIADGAVWPTTVPTKVVAARAGRIGDAWTDPRNPIRLLFGGKRLDLWSSKPVRGSAPPDVRQKTWPRSPIDRFVLAKIESQGKSPAKEAVRRTLIRRMSYDLTGLPPSAEEVREFVADGRPDAVERLADRLLASPRYGEHVARMWLDVVRYSDSNGFDWDEFRPEAWKYRDYVIRSLNADKPFDRFIREQIAGDELLSGPPRNAAERDALLATGYLRLGPQDNSAGAFDEQARARNELLVDLVETTGSAFLGLTLSCCRCHDHKYDPLSQADHYRFRAFFEGVRYGDDLSPALAPEQSRIQSEIAAADSKIATLTSKRDAISSAVRKAIRAERTAKLSSEEKKLLSADEKKLNEAEKKNREQLNHKLEPSAEEIDKRLAGAQKTQFDALEKEIGEIRKSKPNLERALLMTDAPGEPPATRILFQGDHKSPRDAVTPGCPSIFDSNPFAPAKRANPGTAGRRLALADWIASPGNPLTARVVVNRVWQSLFGRGLVGTPNDFGYSGARPTHPELLDWLAADFVRQGWSLKKLHRSIVLSAAYRQSIGSDGDVFAGRSIRRLSAEQLRDSMLVAAGSLKSKAEGPPAWPDLPAEVLQANPAFLDDNAEKTKGWYPSPPADQKVRSIFLVQKRTVRVPLLETFDLPDNATSCPRRECSIVAPQALSLLNSPFAWDLAGDFAGRVRQKAGEDVRKQVVAAFHFALQRPPSPEELRLCEEFVRRHALRQLCRSMFSLNEFAFVD